MIGWSITLILGFHHGSEKDLYLSSYRLFNKSYRGFGRPFRDLVAEDVSERAKTLMRESFEQFDVSKKPHFTTKVTGWPRLGFLNEVFPEACLLYTSDAADE